MGLFDLARRLGANLVIVAFVGAVLFTGFQGKEHYPFSTFSMFSTARTEDTRPIKQFAWVGVTERGETIEGLVAPGGTLRFKSWDRKARKSDPKGKHGLQRRLRVRLFRVNDIRFAPPGDRFETITLYEYRYQIPAWPDGPEPRFIRRRALRTYEWKRSK
jgi:hypothetical protein